MPETKISMALENNSFAVSFMHLKLRRDLKEDYRQVETARQDFVLS